MTKHEDGVWHEYDGRTHTTVEYRDGLRRVLSVEACTLTGGRPERGTAGASADLARIRASVASHLDAGRGARKTPARSVPSAKPATMARLRRLGVVR